MAERQDGGETVEDRVEGASRFLCTLPEELVPKLL